MCVIGMGKSNIFLGMRNLPREILRTLKVFAGFESWLDRQWKPPTFLNFPVWVIFLALQSKSYRFSFLFLKNELLPPTGTIASQS